MHIITIGINYKTAPVEVRERVAFAPNELQDAMNSLKKEKSILENIIVSTCNRTEIYAVVDQVHTGQYYMKRFLLQRFDLKDEELSPYLIIKTGNDAINHLFTVASGLDSMVIGETQILGQVKDSYLLAQENHVIGTIFNQLFKQAITFAKKVHSETGIGENAVSVSYAAVELSKKIFSNLKGCNVLIVGAGKMSNLALQNLYSQGVGKVTVINRTVENAVRLADQFNGIGKGLESLENALKEADIVISSTGSKEYVITEKMIRRIEKSRKGNPLFLVDIAVPRDIEPSIHHIDSAFLYDIDDLQGIVAENLAEREREAVKIKKAITEEIDIFQSWLSMLGVVPVISALREKALDIQADTMSSLERKLPHLSERDLKIIQKHTKSIVNQILRDPIMKAKEMGTSKHSEAQIALFKEIFSLDEILQESKDEKHMQTNQEKETISLKQNLGFL
ncbi:MULTISPECIES: glutamyl-tRNA reductase [Bacillaceae]|uniref:glutamyl-tRNA reductase n=1 Tax=Bacillaceae TaxID=186817 RepID=UPI000BEE50F9|nr:MULTISPECIES: glutamyl-tRNA reductase [unclassified Bacillus (in: firmicutes)]PEC48121.1 glutamyl-tRNA reductase [Bacillus sp. AFS096315]PFM75826.1 glutamyl-tRNA reductase [Bacillus sp. AFS077874]